MGAAAHKSTRSGLNITDGNLSCELDVARGQEAKTPCAGQLAKTCSVAASCAFLASQKMLITGQNSRATCGTVNRDGCVAATRGLEVLGAVPAQTGPK